MGSAVNSLTAPLGVKLFPGGPYADAGLGDQMSQNAQQYMAQLAPIIGQIATAAGVTNPLTGQEGTFSNNLYGLSPTQQGSVNQTAGAESQAYQQIMSKVKANLAARGMSDMMPAAQAYLSQQLTGQLGGQQIQAGQDAYASRMNAMQQMAQLIGSGFGAKQEATNVNRQSAIEATDQGQRQLASALMMGLQLGGVLPGSTMGRVGTPPFAGGTGQGIYGIDTSLNLPGQPLTLPWQQGGTFGNFYNPALGG